MHADDPALRPAASILLLRDGPQGLEVLMLKRAEHLSFAPGAYVFPGGAVDVADHDRRSWLPLINSRRWDDTMPFRIAALRELHEEAGLLQVKHQINKRIKPAKYVAFRRMVARTGLLDTRHMVHFAHWITPEGIKKRFDTHFFVTRWNYRGKLRADGYEAVSLKWVSPRRILSHWEAGKTPLMFPTRLNLMKLAQTDRVAAAMAYCRSTPVMQTLPVISGNGNSRTVKIDGASGFGVQEASARELAVELPVKAPTAPKKQ